MRSPFPVAGDPPASGLQLGQGAEEVRDGNSAERPQASQRQTKTSGYSSNMMCRDLSSLYDDLWVARGWQHRIGRGLDVNSIPASCYVGIHLSLTWLCWLRLFFFGRLVLLVSLPARGGQSSRSSPSAHGHWRSHRRGGPRPPRPSPAILPPVPSHPVFGAAEDLPVRLARNSLSQKRHFIIGVLHTLFDYPYPRVYSKRTHDVNHLLHQNAFHLHL